MSSWLQFNEDLGMNDVLALSDFYKKIFIIK